MKKPLPCFVLFLSFSCVTLSAKDLSRKFGTITKDEIEMTHYEQDTTASAVYLYEETKLFFTYNTSSGSLEQHREHAVKIKILKPEGVSLADVTIPHRKNDVVSGIRASAYNQVDGKIVQTRLKHSDIVTEQLSEQVSLRKFSIPEVRKGTVLEYKYVLLSNYYLNIYPIVVQHAHPVLYSHSEVSAPGFFHFDIDYRGYHPLSVERTQTQNPNFNHPDDTRIITAEHVPALDREPFVWCLEDFRTKIVFEVRQISVGGYFNNLSSTWQSVHEALRNSEFGKRLQMNNLLAEEMKNLPLAGMDEPERVRAILKLVLARMNWNGRYDVVPSQLRQSLEQGSGSSADINMILNAALRAAGFRTTPILLRPRRGGRLPLFHPSLESLSAFVIQVTLSDGRKYIVDGTDPGNDLDLIPPSLMVDRARIYGVDSEAGWIDLTELSPNSERVVVNCTLDSLGNITGEMISMCQNAITYAMKERYNRAGSEEKFIEEREEEENMHISSLTLENLDKSTVIERIAFSMETAQAGNYLYLHAPVIRLMDNAIFTDPERVFPVEFPYPTKYFLIINVTLPEGYRVEELPKSVRISTCENGIEYLYMTTLNDNRLSIKVERNINRAIFSSEEYPDVYAIFGMMIEKSNSRIILQKVR